jgi:hypothetical protein
MAHCVTFSSLLDSGECGLGSYAYQSNQQTLYVSLNACYMRFQSPACSNA